MITPVKPHNQRTNRAEIRIETKHVLNCYEILNAADPIQGKLLVSGMYT